MNFTTDLPKQDPICSYLVATGKIENECYRMHVVVNSQEYSKEYRKSEVLKDLKSKQILYETNNPGYTSREKEKQKLLPSDRNSNTERVILCHVIKIKNEAENENEMNKQLTSKRISSMRSSNRKRKKSNKKYEESDEDDYEDLSNHDFDENKENASFQ